MFRKVALGISGGVDSAVAALLLKQRGLKVIGVFMQNWDIADERGHCTADEDFKDAEDVCLRLNIPIHRVNFVKQYWNEVFCNLIKEYQTGLTPNPDILCNRNIKFNHFYRFATEYLGVDAIATGHYANTTFGAYLDEYEPNKDVRLLRAKDTRKDQTFFLCQIPQTALRKTMFPLGNMTKHEVKTIAIQNGMKKYAFKKESMGICFIGSRKFKDFISEYIEDKPGDFIDIISGKTVGKHNGIHHWTLGQRANIQGVPEAYFTVQKDIKSNSIYVVQGTKHPFLFSNTMLTEPPHWISAPPDELQEGDVMDCEFKFQHTETWADCKVCRVKNGLLIRLAKSKRALTPGQFAVLYKGNECLGGARIINTGPSDYVFNYLHELRSKWYSGSYNSTSEQFCDQNKLIFDAKSM